MNLQIEIDKEEDGRWIAEIISLPGVMAYGQTRQKAITNVKVLALQTLASRIANGEDVPEILDVFAVMS